jgi:hypothetical protein
MLEVLSKCHHVIIKENKKEIPKSIFHEIENDCVSKQINKANSKKETGRDGISTKLLTFAKPKF